MNAKALETLEFDKVLIKLAEYTAFSGGRQLALSLVPSSDRLVVERLLDQTTEARRLLDRQPGFSIRGAFDVRGHVRSAAIGGTLTPESLLELLSTLQAAERIQGVLLRERERLPLLAELVELVDPCTALQHSLRISIGDRGEILDSASPDLARIRAQARVAHQRLWDSLQRVVDSAAYRTVLQEPIITMRGGRYVVPVRADQQTGFKGLVHGQSGSGATLFMEPLATVELNNQWRQLQAQEQEEIERVLRALSALVAEHGAAAAAAVDFLAYLDLLVAKAHYAAALKAEAPALDSYYRVSLERARHPLLGGNAIPIDVHLGVPAPQVSTTEFFVLVITGPNTGGKTVALKTVGLLQLMAQSGLHVPAADTSSVGIFHDVFADIGDEQSLEQSLSTFSSHMCHIVETLRQADERCLVLFDELGAGTDPGEGSAIARAIISWLVKRRIPTLATTHYSELKAFAYAHPGVENAMVEFDPQTLAPTYRLTIGLPGRSNALAIAERLGLSAEVLAEARGMLAPTDAQVEDLLAAIQEERNAAAGERRNASRERLAAQRRREELEARLQHIEDERAAVLERARDEALTLLREARDEVRRARQMVPVATADRAAAATVARALTRAAADMAARPLAGRTTEGAPTVLRPGDRVHVRRLQAVGQVLRAPDERGEVLLQLGGLHTRVPLEELTKTKSAQDTEAPPRRWEPTPPKPAIQMPPAPMAKLDLDLRGRRAVEVSAELERRLDEAYRAGLPFLRVIHGKGTGVLRRIVHEHVDGHPLVEGFELADPSGGGEGVTVVKLAV